MKTLSRLLVLVSLLFLLPTGVALAQTGESPGSSGLILLFGVFVLAIMLLLVEICLIPGFGIAGVAAIGTLAFCAYQSYVLYGATTGTMVTLVLFLLAGAVVYTAIKMMARTASGRAFILDTSLKATCKTGKQDIDPDLWIGRKLTAITDLRPGGKATFDEQTLEVYSESSFVRRDATLEVVKVVSGKLYVKELKQEEAADA